MSIAASALSPLRTPCLDDVAARLARTRRVITAVIVLWFALAVSPTWLPTPDSALYLMLGRSLAQGHGYALDGQPHAYVPPGYPLFLAALERAGLGAMVWLNLAMGVIGLLSVWMSYKLVSELASRPVALLVAGLLGLNSLLHVMSTLQLSDMPFTLLILTGLFCLIRGLKGQKWSLEWGTLALLASCWVRVAGVAIAVACAVGLLLERRAASRLRVGANVITLLAGVGGTLAIFYAQYQNTLRAEHSLPPASYMGGVHALVDQPVTSLMLRALRNAYESAGEIPKFLTGVQSNPLVALAICLSPALVGLGRRLRHREFLVALAVAGYSGGILINLPAGARYFLPVAPLLILYYLEGLALLLAWHSRVRRFAPLVLMLFLGVFVALNGLKGMHAQYKNHHVIAQQRADMGTCAQSLREAVHPGELFLSCDAEWQIAYLSEVPYLQLDRWILAGSLDRDQYLRFLFDQKVRLVISVPEKISHYPDESLIRDAVRNRRLFAPVAQSGPYELYRFLAPPPIATADASARSDRPLSQ